MKIKLVDSIYFKKTRKACLCQMYNHPLRAFRINTYAKPGGGVHPTSLIYEIGMSEIYEIGMSDRGANESGKPGSETEVGKPTRDGLTK
jgi:hypothetical protein